MNNAEILTTKMWSFRQLLPEVVIEKQKYGENAGGKTEPFKD